MYKFSIFSTYVAGDQEPYRDENAGSSQAHRSRPPPRYEERANGNMSAASSLTSIRTGDMNIDSLTGRPRPAPRRKGKLSAVLLNFWLATCSIKMKRGK